MALAPSTQENESDFVEQVFNELDVFVRKDPRKSVLLFPPLSSRLRFLIHKTVNDLTDLVTFSVGDGFCRRVVVCSSQLKRYLGDDRDSENKYSSYKQSPGSRVGKKNNFRYNTSTSRRTQMAKRPDRVLYVPRAMREKLSVQNSHGPTSNADLESSSECSNLSSPGLSNDSSSLENTPISSTSGQACLSTVDNILSTSSESLEPSHQEKMEKEMQNMDDNKDLVCEKIQSCLKNMTLEDEKDLASLSCGVQIDDTHTDDILEEIKSQLKADVRISIEHAQNDYSGYESVLFSCNKFQHVIEIYDFPANFKTIDLVNAFEDYREGGFKINWVDSTHALGVFSSEAAALHALSICHPQLKARGLAAGSEIAKIKAVKSAELLLPVKQRPRTDFAVARRMVTRALGIQGPGKVPRH